MRLALPALLLAACTLSETDYADLPTPNFWLSQGDGRCSTNLVLDANRDLWFDHGCQTPVDFHVAGQATAEQHAAVVSAFAALPAAPEDCASDTDEVFETLSSSASGLRWSVCVDARGNPVAPYAAAIDALRAIPLE